MDVIGSLLGICLGAPLLVISCIIVIVVDHVPPVFVQARFGLGGKPFNLVKLRTLKVLEKRDDVDPYRIHKKPDYETTRTGKFWRKTSIDELMQFWLVLKGEMSLIGHRPFPMYYIPHLKHLEGIDECDLEFYLQSIKCFKPGMSSLASVSGRSSLTMQEKFAFDLYYLQQATLIYDLKLIIHTLWVVISCKNAK